jgi:hypothetical protein
MTTRRGFLCLCGAAGAGVLIARAELGRPARRMTLQAAGTCSFCGKSRHELHALVGVGGRPARLCDECLPCMLDVIVRDPPSTWPASVPGAACGFCGRPYRQVRVLLSGPRVFLCDGCATEAAGLFEASGRRMA